MPKWTVKLLLTKSISWDVVLPQVKEIYGAPFLIVMMGSYNGFLLMCMISIKSPFQGIRYNFYGILHGPRNP